MLEHLRIKNFAIIADAELRLGPGLSVLTGETGAGKSIIIEALSLLTGGKTSDSPIKHGSDEAFIEAIFTRPESQEHLIISKKIKRNKGTLTQVNGKTVTLKQLKALMATHINLTSQHDTLKLFDPQYAKTLIDGLASPPITPALDTYNRAFTHYQTLKKELEDEEKTEVISQEYLDFLNFQEQELNSANLVCGEEEKLIAQKKQYKHIHHLKTHISNLKSACQSALDNLHTAVDASQKITDIDPSFKSLQTGIESLLLDCEEYPHNIREQTASVSTIETLDIDAIESRLDVLFRLKTKYKASNSDALLRLLEKKKAELKNTQQKNSRLQSLIGIIQKQEKSLSFAAEKLHLIRQKSAFRLSSKIETELHDLGMSNATLPIIVSKISDFHPDGMDTVTIHFSSNPGEPPKPLQKIASGGELSRVMLALHAISHSQTGATCLVFDEIDTGIGGLTAHKIGQKLATLARKKQVLCITHLPQIAQLANHHYLVKKEQRKEMTHVTLQELHETERKKELYRMVGGDTISKAILT